MWKNDFAKGKELLRGEMNIMLKKRIVKCFIWSEVLQGLKQCIIRSVVLWIRNNVSYGVWCCRDRKLGHCYKKTWEAFEMWIWRKMAKVSWKEHRTNEGSLSMVQEERCMVRTIGIRHNSWNGHIHRAKSHMKIALEGRMKGKKTAGRPRRMLLDWMFDKDSKRNYQTVKELA